MGELLPKQVLKNEKIFDSISDWISIIDLDKNIKYTNISGEKLFGLSKDKIINQKCCKIIHNKDTQIKNCPVKKMLNSKKQETVEIYLEEKNKWYKITVNPIFDKNKKITGAVHIVREITERMKVGDSFRITEGQYQNIVNLVPDSIITLDLKGFITSCNEKALNFGDFNSKEELIGKHISQLKTFRKRDIPKLTKTFLSVIKGSKNIPSYHFQFIGKDGKMRWAEGRYRLQYDNKKVIGIQAIIRDIPNIKKIEEALKDSEEKYRIIINSSLEGFLIINMDWDILEVNNSYCKILGYNRDELLSMNLSEIEVNLSKSEMEEIQKKVIKKGFAKFETKHKKKDGVKIDVSILVQLSKGGYGFAFVNDITEKKKTEDALKVEKLKIETYFENIIDGIGIIDLNGKITKVNHNFSKIHGYKTKEEVIGENIIKFIAESSRDRALLSLQDIIKKGVIKDFEIHSLTKHGKEFPTLINATLIDSGDKKEIIAVLKNISDKKKAEGKMIESEEKYRSIVDSSDNVIVRADCDGIINYINHTVTGLSKDKVIGKTLYDYVDPKYHKLVRETLEKVVNTGKPANYELKGVGPRGSSAWYHNTISPIIHDGKINAVTIITKDITDQKKAEITIKESEEKYKSIIETAPTIIIVIDKNFIIKDVNYTVSGLDKKDVIGKKVFEFIEPRFHKKVEKTIEYVIKTKKSSQYEIQGKGPNNSIVWYDNRIGPIIKDGKVTEIIIMGNDITERKKREREIQKQFMKYDIEEGNCYLVLEKSNIKSTNAFDDVLKTGYNGIILSREKLKDLKIRINNNFNYLWLSEKPYNNSINPKNIEKYIEQIKDPTVILLNRFDYIMQKLGFNKTLSLLQSINEIAYMNNHIIIISIDSNIIDIKQLYLIEKETIELEPKQKIQLDNDQINILKYIFKKNLLNEKPNYTNLCDYLHTSKPTMRNKIRSLKEKGYLIEYKSGNKKILEISEKTRNLIT
jgi:PAS domain S-box-containing protein